MKTIENSDGVSSNLINDAFEEPASPVFIVTIFGARVLDFSHESKLMHICLNARAPTSLSTRSKGGAAAPVSTYLAIISTKTVGEQLGVRVEDVIFVVRPNVEHHVA